MALPAGLADAIRSSRREAPARIDLNRRPHVDRWTGQYTYTSASSDTVVLEMHGENKGGTVYTAGLALARYCEALALDGGSAWPLGGGGTALELGSGTGLVGLVLSRVLRSHVILTDIADNLPNLRANAEANRGSSRPLVAELEWSAAAAWSAGTPGGAEGTARTMALVARAGAGVKAGESELPGGISMILGADLCYDADAVPPLAATLTKLSELAPDAPILLANDLAGRPGLRALMVELRRRFAVVTSVPPEVLARLAPGVDTTNVELVWLRRRRTPATSESPDESAQLYWTVP